MIGNTKLLLSSYSCKWSLGFAKWKPEKPRDIEWFIDFAADYGLDGVQIADNVAPHLFHNDRVSMIAEYAGQKGVEVQWGFQDWTAQKAERMVEISSLSGSRILRAVMGKGYAGGKNGTGEASVEKSFHEIAALLPKLERENIVLALENHFDLKIKDILSLLGKISSPHFGICLDTSNAIGEIIHPLDCIRQLARHSVCLHLKDYRIEKIVGGYRILGAAIGAGDQDTRSILTEALTLNPSIEICIELGTAFPETMDEVFKIESRDVTSSIEFTRTILEEYYHEISGRSRSG